MIEQEETLLDFENNFTKFGFPVNGSFDILLYNLYNKNQNKLK
jgi:hypothetical protein